MMALTKARLIVDMMEAGLAVDCNRVDGRVDIEIDHRDYLRFKSIREAVKALESHYFDQYRDDEYLVKVAYFGDLRVEWIIY